MKKMCRLIACVILAACLLTSCDIVGNINQSESESSTKEAGITTGIEEAKTGKTWNETLKFSICADLINWTRDNLDINGSEEDKFWSAYSNTDITYITPPHTDADKTISLKLASGDYADAFLFYADWSKIPKWETYAEEGIFISLEDYWNSEIGKKAVEEVYTWDKPFMKCTFEGERYGIPLPGSAGGSLGTIVRADWLNALGLKNPETLDEYRNVLKAFTYNDPDKNGKDDTYGFTARKDLAYAATFQGAFGVDQHDRVTYDLIDGKIVPQQTQEKYKQYLQFMRMLVYEDKVFVPDVILRTSDQWKEDIFAGHAGMWYHQNYRIDEYFMTNIMLANPDWQERGIEIDFCNPPTGGPNTGKTGPYNSTAINAWNIQITDKAKDPQQIFNYFIWILSDKEVKDIVKYGLPGRDHTETDGKKQWVENVEKLNLLRFLETVYLEYGLNIDDEYYALHYGKRAAEAITLNLKYGRDAKTFLLGIGSLPEDLDFPDTDSVVLQYSLKIICGEIGVDEGFEEMKAMLQAKGLNERVAARQAWYENNQ